MSHSTSIKRRLGAALTSFVTAAALVVPLATPAWASHDDVNLMSTDIESDVQNGPSGTFHLTATSLGFEAGEVSQVQFAADCDDNADFEVVIGSDTSAPYAFDWDTSTIEDGTSCEVRARAFYTEPDGDDFAEDIDSVTVDNAVPGVQIASPAHGGLLAYNSGASDSAIVTGTVEEGSSQSLAVWFTTDDQDDGDQSWSRCGFESPAVDLDPDTAGIQFSIACSAPDLSGALGVMVETYDRRSDGYGYDAHEVTLVASDPELFTVGIDPKADEAAAGLVCNEYTVTILDIDGNPMAGVNVDAHATGPDDELAFAISMNTSPFSAADGSGVYAGDAVGHAADAQSAADCTRTGEETVFEGAPDTSGLAWRAMPASSSYAQRVHEDPADLDEETGANSADEADTKHIEGYTDALGQFTFAIFSPNAGETAIEVWADTAVEDDINDAAGANRERDTTASKTWYDAVPTTLTLDPDAAFNNLRTDHTVTATLLDQNGVPLFGWNVEFDMTGPNEDEVVFDTCAETGTDGLGMCTFTYTDANAGEGLNGYTDSISAWVNTGDARDISGSADDDEPQDTATKTWVDVDGACLDADPEYALNPSAGVHTMLVTVRASDGVADGVCTGDPIPNATVTAEIVDDNPDASLTPDADGDSDYEELLTDANGQVSFDLSLDTPTESGWNTVEFRLDGDTNYYGCCSSSPWDEVDGPSWCESCTDDNNYDVQNENGFDSVDKEWAIPGEPYDLSLAPRYATNELLTDHTVVATVTDAFGTPVAGEDVTIHVDAGPNAGKTVTCTTNAAGQCSFTYTDTGAVDGDWDDIEGYVVADSDVDGWAYKQWVEDATAAVIGLDMETASRGDGSWESGSEDWYPDTSALAFGVNDTDPDTADDWDVDAVPNEVGDVHRIVASAKSGDASGFILSGRDMDFTIDGVGEFVEWDHDAEMWISLGTSVATPIVAGYDGPNFAVVWIRSTEIGTSTVTVSMDDVEATGTKDWYAAAARNVTLLPPTQRALPGTVTSATAMATDRFGNPVANWLTCFSETGPGVIRGIDNAFTETCGFTDEDGKIAVEVETNDSESGTQTLTANLDGRPRFLAADDGGPECAAHEGEDRWGNDQAAPSPEGNCTAEAVVIWSSIGNAVDVDPTDPTTQTIPLGSSSCFGGVASDSNGNGVPDQAVGARLTGANGSVTPTVNTGDCPSGTTGSGTGSGTTDANGVFSATYTPTNSGTDTLRLFVDLNENGAYDDGEPFTDYVLSVEAGGGVDTGDTVRLAGPNRIATALAISGASFADDAAGAVVLARSDDFPDALAGTPLAVAKNAPTLLTESSLQSSTLNSDTRAEIDRVLPSGGTVYILGGTVAVPAGAESELVGAGYTVIRLGGADRYATAILIADAVSLNPDSILITTGTNFPDALAAGSAAVSVSGVIVLSRGTEKASATDAYLARAANADATLFAIGGPSVTAYGGSVPDANEIAGATRLSTSINVANRFFSAPTVVGIATMRNFPDALTGGAHIARLGGPLVLVNGDNLAAGLGSQDAGIVQAYLEGDAESIDVAYIYGGTVVVSNFAQLQIDNAITANN